MIILLLLSIIGITLLLNCIKHIKPSESPLITCSLIIIYIYIFALVGLLEFGVWSLMILGILSLPITFIIKRKQLKEFFNSLINPGYLLFIFLIIVLYPICRPIVTGAWDEYSHWALIVRNMLITGHLPKPGSAVTYLSYPPATSLFQYLFMKMSSGVEGMMYYAQAILIASCLSTLLKGQNFRKPLYLVMMIILPVVVMIKFSVHNIFNIFPDTLMAIASISVFVCYHNSDNSYWRMLKVLPVLFFICLIRANAITFAFFSILLILITQIQERGFKFRIVLKNFIILMLPLVISYASWSMHVRLLGAKGINTNFFPVDVPRLLTMLDNFKRALFFTPLGNAYPLFNLLSSTVAFLILSIIVIVTINILLRKSETIKTFNKQVITSFICLILYSLSLIYTYQYIFTVADGIVVSSFSRYMGTYFIFWTIIIFYLMVNILKQEKLILTHKRILSVLCVLIIITVSCLSHPFKLNIIGSRRLENVYQQESIDCANDIQSVVGTEPKVYMIFQKSRGYTFMGTRYRLGSNQTNLGTWSLGKPYSDTDTWTVDISPDDIYQRFIDLNYEYVYVGGGDAQLWDNYGMLFDKPNSEYKVFKVTPDGEFPLTAVIK